MQQTGKNLQENGKIKLAITNREVQVTMYKGAGFLICGSATIEASRKKYESIKEKHPWAKGSHHRNS